MNTLPVGNYNFNFEVDDNMDNIKDGTYADSVDVNVQSTTNTPPTADITSPSTGSTYNQGDSVTFSGTGYDTEDGYLSGGSLVWTSSVDGQIGTGVSFTKSNISVGTHTITLTATDSEGATGSESVSITVESIVISNYNLPDTGQWQNYTDTFGEDSDYSINPPSYIDNGDGTVTDNVTGLMWQQEDDDIQYNWYEATGTFDDEYNPGGAIDVCGSLTLAGYNDWRLPTLKKLEDVVDYGTSLPAIDETYFPDTNDSSYWSSTNTYNICCAWDVHFGYGDDHGYGTKSNNRYVRCVRGRESPSNSFTDNSDGTVTDNNTGLMWQQEDDDTIRMWEDVITYCEDLSLVGYSDWRLPNIKELRSIVDFGTSYPAIDETYFPNTNVSSYWSSTTYSYDTSDAWLVYFYSGDVYYSAKSSYYYIRCVRGGE